MKQQMMEWHPITDDLPIPRDSHAEVLVTMNYQKPEVWSMHVLIDKEGKRHWNCSKAYDGEYHLESEMAEERFLAWMMFPEPYKEVER